MGSHQQNPFFIIYRNKNDYEKIISFIQIYKSS